jgi:outer membrane murein-binding lipoprotein Lpp
MPSADLTFRSFARLTVRFTAVLRGAKAMSGKNNLVDNLSRNPDRARGKRDALASDVTTLTAQIAEIEARLIEEKTRRERGRVLGEIEAIKKRIQQTASAFAPVIGELCEATEMAVAVVPEARELNSFLLSVATEVDTVIDSLLREPDRHADAVRVGHAALDLPCLANESPTELPRDKSDRLLRFLSRNKEVEKRNSGEPAQHSSVIIGALRTSKKTLDAHLQI